MTQVKPEILVYHIGSLGDTIVAIPALRVVRREFPDHAIVLLHNAQTAGVVEASQVVPDDLIDAHLSYTSHREKLRSVTELLRLSRDIRRRKFAAVVYLLFSERPPRAVWRDKLFFRLCGIRRTLGFHAFAPEELRPRDASGRPMRVENEAVRKLQRLERDKIEILPDHDLQLPLLKFRSNELRRARQWLSEHRRQPEKRLIAIAPGCKTRANAWAVSNFIELGKRLIAADCELLVVGGAAERQTGERMILDWGAGVNAAGEFSVRESGALLSLCDSYIGLDTGTTHLAVGVGLRCLAIYGERNNPGQWFPLGDNYRVVNHPVECAGCRRFVCPIENHPCMTGITVDKVWQTWLELDGSSDKNQRRSTTAITVLI